MISTPDKHWFSRPVQPDSGFSVHGIGSREMMQPCTVNRPGGTGDILFMLFHNPVDLGCQDQVTRIDAGTLMIWDTTMGHYYGNATEPWSHSWIHCGGRRAVELLHTSGITVGLPLATREELFLDTLQSLYEEMIHPLQNASILESLLRIALLRINRELPAVKAAIPAHLLAVQQTIEKAWRDNLSLGDLAQQAHLSASHFSAEFRRHFGIAPLQYQTQLRMEAAVYLLRDINLSIANIAERVGYPDIYHFSKIFKKYFNLSPRAKRRVLLRSGC